MTAIPKLPAAIASFAGIMALLLAGCSNSDPFAQPGTWHENDAPMQNVAAELVNPHDLVMGRESTTLTGTIAVSALGQALDQGSQGATGASKPSAGSSAGTTGGLGMITSVGSQP